MKDSERIDELIEPARDTILRLFKLPGDELSDNDISVARIASSIMATWSRLKTAERAQEAVYFSMARELSTDREQLAQYIRMSLPDVPLVKVLDAKKLPSLKADNTKK